MPLARKHCAQFERVPRYVDADTGRRHLRMRPPRSSVIRAVIIAGASVPAGRAGRFRSARRRGRRDCGRARRAPRRTRRTRRSRARGAASRKARTSGATRCGATATRMSACSAASLPMRACSASCSAAEFDHAGGHEDAAPVGLAQHVEQFERRSKPDRVRVVGVVDHDRAVRLALDFEAMGDLRRAPEAGDDILGRQAEAARGGEGERDVAPVVQPVERRAQFVIARRASVSRATMPSGSWRSELIDEVGGCLRRRP